MEFTADIENQFDKISEGKEEWKQVIRTFYGPFEKEVKKVDEELEHVQIQDEVSDVKCEKCGRMMVVKYGRYGKFLACPGYPDCSNIKPFLETVDVPCPVCGAEVYVRKTKRGRNYYICANNKGEGEGCNYISWNKPKVGEEWTPEIEKELNSEKSKKLMLVKKQERQQRVQQRKPQQRRQQLRKQLLQEKAPRNKISKKRRITHEKR